MMDKWPNLIKRDGSLDGRLVLHRLQTLRPLLKLEGLVDDTLDLDLARVEVVDGGGEFIDLTEATEDGDLVADLENNTC
jgi:hypothetical protein